MFMQMADCLFRVICCALFYKYAFVNPDLAEDGRECWAVKGEYQAKTLPPGTIDAVDVTKRFTKICVMLFDCLLVGAIISCWKNWLYLCEKNSTFFIANWIYMLFINIELIVCIVSSIWRYN